MVKTELRVEEFIPPRDLTPKLADGLGLRVEEFIRKHWSLDVCTHMLCVLNAKSSLRLGR